MLGCGVSELLLDLRVWVVFLIFAGPCLGSFASAIAYRVPRGMSWVSDKGKGARSCCPSCGGQLKAVDLIPILSWAFNRGRCRMCGAKVSIRYPLLELAALILSLLLVYMILPGTVFFCSLAMLPFWLALWLISWNGHGLPRQLSLIVGAIGVVMLAILCQTDERPLDLLAGHIAGAILYMMCGAGLVLAQRKILRLKALPSLNDPVETVIFFGAAGLWLGFKMLPVFLIVVCLYGLLTAGLRWLKEGKARLSLDNAFVVSFLVILVAGTQIMAQLL